MKLATKRGDVDFNCALAEPEILGNLFVRHASGETLQHIALARPPWSGLRMKCTKCGGRNVDVRPNWKEQPPAESLTGKQWR
jgi:hypothetical protein